MSLRHLYIGMFVMIALAFEACNDDTPTIGTPKNPDITDISHWKLFGLSDSIREVSTTYYDEQSADAEGYNEEKLSFDSCGRLVSYVTSELNCVYEYVSDTLINNVNVIYSDERGEVKYHFSYSGHGAYVSCPVSFGGLSNYLIHNLSEVTAVVNEGDYVFSYICDGTTMKCKEVYGGMQMAETVAFENKYPQISAKTIAVDGAGEGEYMQTVDASYVYSNGRLLSLETVTVSLFDGTKHVNASFSDGQLEQEDVSVILEGEESSYIDNYTYDERGSLLTKKRKFPDGSEEMVETGSYQYDEYGNWVSKTGQMKSPWGLVLTPYYVKRSFKYISSEN